LFIWISTSWVKYKQVNVLQKKFIIKAFIKQEIFENGLSFGLKMKFYIKAYKVVIKK